MRKIGLDALNDALAPAKVMAAELGTHSDTIDTAITGHLKLNHLIDGIPNEINVVLDKHKVPRLVFSDYRFKGMTFVLNGKINSIASYAARVDATLTASNGNWIAPLVNKYEDYYRAEITVSSIRVALYTTMYEEILNALKDPLMAFRATLNYIDSIETFVIEFKEDSLEAGHGHFFTNEIEVIKITRQIVEFGHCLGYKKFVRKSRYNFAVS